MYSIYKKHQYSNVNTNLHFSLHVAPNNSVIPAPSVWEGGLTPDLNGQRRFLRGGSDEEALTLEDDQLQGVILYINLYGKYEIGFTALISLYISKCLKIFDSYFYLQHRPHAS